MISLKSNLFRTTALLFTAALMMVVLLSCGNNGVTTPDTTTGNNTSVSVKLDDNVQMGYTNISITEAKFLIKSVEYELEGTGIEKEVELGPDIVSMNVNGNINTILNGRVPAGVYDRIKFEVHKPEDNEYIPDPDFTNEGRWSFIIKGSYNNSPFVYRSGKSQNLVINFNKPVNLQSAEINITMLVNKLLWFVVNGIEIDPRDHNYENEIDDNIKNSFRRAFKDNDKNGLEDE